LKIVERLKVEGSKFLKDLHSFSRVGVKNFANLSAEGGAKYLPALLLSKKMIHEKRLFGPAFEGRFSAKKN
jgi:hypothetical protein